VIGMLMLPTNMLWFDPVNAAMAPSEQLMCILVPPLIALRYDRGRLHDSAGLPAPATFVARGGAG